MTRYKRTYTNSSGKKVEDILSGDQLSEVAYSAWCAYVSEELSKGKLINEISPDDFASKDEQLIGVIKEIPEE